jgi:hypothetical protein
VNGSASAISSGSSSLTKDVPELLANVSVSFLVTSFDIEHDKNIKTTEVINKFVRENAFVCRITCPFSNQIFRLIVP